MPTLGVKLETTMATDRHRTPIGSFYKGVSLDGIHVEVGRQIQAGEKLEINLNQTSFFSLAVQAFSHSSKVIDLVLHAMPLEDEDNSDVESKVEEEVEAASNSFSTRYGEPDTPTYVPEPEKSEEPKPQVVILKNISMLVCEASNITHIEIINSSSDQHAVIDLIY